MNDLERVREALTLTCGCPWAPAQGPLQSRPHLQTCRVSDLDAHLKEDAEREATLEECRSILTEARNREGEVSDELTELREAVREHIDGNGAPNRTHDRLRQLIEEEP